MIDDLPSFHGICCDGVLVDWKPDSCLSVWFVPEIFDMFPGDSNLDFQAVVHRTSTAILAAQIGGSGL